MSSLAALLMSVTFAPSAEPFVVPITEAVRTAYSLSPHYQKMARGVEPLVLGSKAVSDDAIAEAAWIVTHMLSGRDDIRQAMVKSKTRLVVIAATESTTDVPEHAFLRTKMYWDRRARGLGATPKVPVVSCGEENVLGFARDPYPNENIVIHEYAHAMHLTGLNIADPKFDDRLKASFERAKNAGLWANTYAATNKEEYWAEGVQCWFDDNAPPDSLHNHIRTRDQLKKYDPGLAELCKGVFGEPAWRYVRPHLRPVADRSHITHFDFKKPPRFQWKAYAITDKPVVKIQTSAGDFEVTLDTKTHPVATKTFLALCLDGAYHSGSFDRVHLKPDGNGWVYGQTKVKWREDYSKDLKLDPLPADAKPEDGSIAFVRNGTLGEFVIFIGPPTGSVQNLISFGKVSAGMDIIKSILQSKAENGKVVKPVDLRRAIRSE